MGGLAGSEAAWQCLNLGAKVKLYEMRPNKSTEAHKTGDLAELVCSNSLKAMDVNTASGLLKYEMNKVDSLIVAQRMKQKFLLVELWRLIALYFQNTSWTS